MNNASKRIGRPPVREAKLRDGIYVEIRNKGSKEKGLKIRCADKKELEILIARYKTTKDIEILGEYKNGEKKEK